MFSRHCYFVGLNVVYDCVMIVLLLWAIYCIAFFKSLNKNSFLCANYVNI